MKTRSFRIIALALVLAFLPAAGITTAGTSVDFLFSMNHVSNDNQYFLNLAVSDYGYSRHVIEPCVPRLRYVEADLPVVMFLADYSGRPPVYIADMRERGYGWATIFTRLDVPPDVLFVGLRRDPGPPYGKAWGHWKKHRRDVRLSDSDISGLVQVQMGSRFSRLSQRELAQARGRGTRVVTLVADEKGRPYKGKHGHKDKWGKGKPDKDKEHSHGRS